MAGPYKARTPLRAITTQTRKGLLNLTVLVMVSIFSTALAIAAYSGKLPWKEAFELGAIAMGMFGFHSGVTSLGIAHEDAARLSQKTDGAP